jgi:hypothetical protein
MSLQSVSQQCGVPFAKVIEGLKLPLDSHPNSLIKDLVAQGKIGEVTAVQKVVAELQK